MSQVKKLTILQMNDSHSYLETHPEFYWQGNQEIYRNAGGYARISSLFKQVRQENPDRVITLDNGDTIHGTYPAVSTKGQALVPILNKLAFDAMTAHWEFAYGPDNFKEIAGKLAYPVLAINCYDKATNRLVFPPYLIVERGGLRIGIVGVAATIIDKTMPKHFSEGMYFTLGNTELPEFIRRLKEQEKVDLIIVLSHLGYPQELKLTEEVSGIDVLLSDHTHNRLYQAVLSNGALVMQSGSQGSFIGRLDLEVEQGKIRDFKHRLINVDETINPDSETESLIDKIMQPDREMLNTPVGSTRIALNRNRVLETTYSASFVTTQGIPEHFGRNRKNLEVKAIEALKQYLARHNPASAELKGTIVPI